MTVRSRERHRVAEPEAMELDGVEVAAGSSILFASTITGLPEPQDRRQLLVAGRDPGPRVDDEEDEVGLADRCPRLLGDLAPVRPGVCLVDAARVDEPERDAVPVPQELLAVAVTPASRARRRPGSGSAG